MGVLTWSGRVDDTFISLPASQQAIIGRLSASSAGMMNLPQFMVELLGNFSAGGLAVPVCKGAAFLVISLHLLHMAAKE